MGMVIITMIVLVGASVPALRLTTQALGNVGVTVLARASLLFEIPPYGHRFVTLSRRGITVSIRERKMTILIRSVAAMLLVLAVQAEAYDQIFKVKEGLMIRNPYYGDQGIISIRVYGDYVNAYSKDKYDKQYNDKLFTITPGVAPYREFIFDILEKGRFVILPNQTGKIEDLRIIYKEKKYSFLEAVRYLNDKDLCGLAMECPSSEMAEKQGRRTTAPGTEGPLERASARKVDYMTRVNIF